MSYIFFAILAIIAIFIKLKSTFKESNSAKWPSVEGNIIDCCLTQKEDTFEISDTSHNCRKSYTYSLKTAYEYTVDGKNYQSTEMESSSSPIPIKFDPNDIAPVFFNPENNGDSRLTIGIKKDTVFTLGLSILALIVLMFILFFTDSGFNEY